MAVASVTAVARRRGLWRMAILLAPLVLAGLILMHGVDAGAVESVTGGADRMTTAAHPPEIGGMSSDDHGCDGCHVAGHVTVVCVAALASVALWRFVRALLGNTDTDPSMDGRTGGAGPPSPVPRWRPAWLELSVILR
jgi:uncharacterized protein DUF6153